MKSFAFQQTVFRKSEFGIERLRQLRSEAPLAPKTYSHYKKDGRVKKKLPKCQMKCRHARTESKGKTSTKFTDSIERCVTHVNGKRWAKFFNRPLI